MGRTTLFQSKFSLLAGGILVAWGATLAPGLATLAWEPKAAAGVAILTFWCWITGALPLPVASLLPALCLPLLGVASAGTVASWYFHDILLLLLGGFVLALALQKEDLHRRFAFRILRTLGARPRRLVLGFMAVAAFLSMFLSNTATALLLLPVALAILDRMEKEEQAKLAVPLLLGLAYACSIGGTATPVGTAPNAVLLGQIQAHFPQAPAISFGQWFVGALPFVGFFVVLVWWVLTRWMGSVPAEPSPSLSRMMEEITSLPRRTRNQNRVLVVFLGVVFLWLTRRELDLGIFTLPGWGNLLPPAVALGITDSTVALFGMVILFLLPRSEGGVMLEWRDCRELPWGVLLLMGGGFAIAHSMDETGLSRVVGDALAGPLQVLPPVAMVALTVLGVTFLTEMTSNTATVNVLLPLLFSSSVAAGIHPLLLALPATFAASCAFMLPAATPPNAILFSSGRLKMAEMVKAGLVLNLLSCIVVTLFVLAWTAPRWGLDLFTFPSWATLP